MAKLQIGIAHQPDEQPEAPNAGGRKRRTDVEQITEILTRAGHEVLTSVPKQLEEIVVR